MKKSPLLLAALLFAAFTNPLAGSLSAADAPAAPAKAPEAAKAPAPTPAPKPTPKPVPPLFDSPVTVDNLDTAAFAEWVDGKEAPLYLRGEEPKNAQNSRFRPDRYILTASDHVSNWAFRFGDTKSLGVRHLRFGFKEPVRVGSLLARCTGKVSVLKPDAPYPGDLSDESQWIPLERLRGGSKDGDEMSYLGGPGLTQKRASTSGQATVVGEETSDSEVTLWTLPAVTEIRAIRISHTAVASDNTYYGTVGGIHILGERFANVAPQAAVEVRSMPKYADRLNDNLANSWQGWANLVARKDDRPKTIAEDPEWIVLTWPKPVTLQKIGAMNAGFAAGDVQIYVGKDKFPKGKLDSDWKTLKGVSGITSHYPSQLFMDWINLDQSVTTKAIRVRLTETFDGRRLHGHMQADKRAELPDYQQDNTNGGKRVWLEELLALEPLGKADLKTAILPPPPAPVVVNAPIAISFNLPEPGRVTLVVEDADGKRVRNLIADTPFPKGKNTVYWDATDDLGRDKDAATHGLYSIPPQFVAPGSYTVRGLYHGPLDLVYELSVYSPGNPPWPTNDSVGGWMTNHTPAGAAVFVPAESTPAKVDQVYIGSYVSEGGAALSWVDLNGDKLGGRGWIGGAWTGAQHLARDNGEKATPGVIVYVASCTHNVDITKGEVRLTALTAISQNGDRPIMKPVYTFDVEEKYQSRHAENFRNFLGGIAVHNRLLALTQPLRNNVTLIRVNLGDVNNTRETATGKVLGEFPLANPTGVAFDKEGRLLLLSEKTLLRYPAMDAASDTVALGEPEKLVTDLQEPTALTVDAKGNIYVADRGQSHQIKVFAADGKPVKTYGKPGAPKTGIYDPNHINNPLGIAVDANGRLWVTEEDFQPKRVSVWNPDGTLWKAYYGPQQYGGGGSLDYNDPNRFSYEGMEFLVDWKKGEAPLHRVYYRFSDPDSFKLAWRNNSPESALYFNGHRYLSNIWNNNPVAGSTVSFLFLDNGVTANPVAAAGKAKEWDILKTDPFKPRWPEGVEVSGSNNAKNNALFLWSDLNSDGKVQPEEVQMTAATNGGVTLNREGAFLLNNVRVGNPDSQESRQNAKALRFKPVSFTEKGVPVYDITKSDVIADAQGPGSSGADQILDGTDGWSVMTTPPRPYANSSLGGARNGKPVWSYPSLWPGLHASHEAPAPSFPGELIGTTRLLGDYVTPKNSDAGPLFFINSNMGNMYVLTQDGLFVSQLFEDVRQGPLWKMPMAQRGMKVNGLSLHDENFFPSVSQTPDGKIYMMAGGTPALVRVDGLETIRRIPPVTVKVTEKSLAEAKDYVTKQEAARQAAQGSANLAVLIRSKAPAMDGSLTGWEEAEWAPIDYRGVGANFNSDSRPYNSSGAVMIAEGNLYAYWKTEPPRKNQNPLHLLQNSGEVENAPFKTGGALDLMLGTNPAAKADRRTPVEGDLRLLVTMVKGATKALLYRAVVPGTPVGDKVAFSAPWHSLSFDSVADISDKVKLASDKNGGYTISIPLSVLKFDPKPGQKLKADIGLLRGNGVETTQRVYWTNKATNIVSDVPTEAELTPALWGTFEIQSK